MRMTILHNESNKNRHECGLHKNRLKKLVLLKKKNTIFDYNDL